MTFKLTPFRVQQSLSLRREKLVHENGRGEVQPSQSPGSRMPAKREDQCTPKRVGATTAENSPLPRQRFNVLAKVAII